MGGDVTPSTRGMLSVGQGGVPRTTPGRAGLGSEMTEADAGLRRDPKCRREHPRRASTQEERDLDTFRGWCRYGVPDVGLFA